MLGFYLIEGWRCAADKYPDVQVRYAMLDFTTANVGDYNRVWMDAGLDKLDVGILGENRIKPFICDVCSQQRPVWAPTIRTTSSAMQWKCNAIC